MTEMVETEMMEMKRMRVHVTIARNHKSTVTVENAHIVGDENMIEARRIKTIEDVIYIHDGIRDGIQSGVFTDIKLTEILELVVSHDVMFFIFERDNEKLGFGAIRQNREVHKVYVQENMRGNGYGKLISMWLKARILEGGYVPVCWVKEGNKWNNSMAEMGMEKTTDGYGGVNKYQLSNFEKYVEAHKKCKVDTVETKYKTKKMIDWQRE